MTLGLALPSTLTWAEDRATQGCDPSAVPRARTEARMSANRRLRAHLSLRFWRASDKPSRHDAAMTDPTGSHHRVANRSVPKFHFPVNQDSFTCSEKKMGGPVRMGLKRIAFRS